MTKPMTPKAASIASSHDVIAGLATALRVLLGDDVADEMEARLGQHFAEFARLHVQYDHLSEKHPDSDPVTAALDDAAPRFDGFDDYVQFLRRMTQRTAQMRTTPGPEFHAILAKMLEVAGKAAPKEKEAKAAVEGERVRYAGSAQLGRALPRVPLQMKTREGLPYSYPSYDATAALVAQVWGGKKYAERMTSELNDIVRASLKSLAERIRHTEHVEVGPADLVIATQEYLMRRNWIHYGIEEIGEVSFYTALAGYEHDLTVDGELLISSQCNVWYELIGGNLEKVLRKVMFNLSREVMSGNMLAGRQPGVDVVIACCSELVQDEARTWLRNLRETWI